MKLIFWLIALVSVILTVDFVMSNDRRAELSLWLFPWSIELPLGLAVLLAFAGGMLFGGFMSWLSGSRARFRARSAERRIGAMEREMSGLARRAASAEREAAASTALPQPAGMSGAAAPPQAASESR